MAQYVFSMNRVNKTVPPKRHILKDISLSFFPGAKIGVLGLNGSGKSTLLRIIAGVDRNYEGKVTAANGYSIGYLEQEPLIDDTRTVIEVVRDGAKETFGGEVVNITNRGNKTFDSFDGFNAQTGVARVTLDKMFPILPAVGLVFER